MLLWLLQPSCLMNHVSTGSPEEPLIIDSEPLGFTQGHIIASDKEDLTIDIQIMEGYTPVKDCGGRIEVFSPDGVMLPHNQDPTKGVEDLGKPFPDHGAGCPDQGLMLMVHGQLFRGCRPDHSTSMVVQPVIKASGMLGPGQLALCAGRTLLLTASLPQK